MQRLISLAQNANFPHIVTLAKISMANTLEQLGYRRYMDPIEGITRGLNECQFAIPCLTMLAEYATVSNLNSPEAKKALSQGSKLRYSIDSLNEAISGTPV